MCLFIETIRIEEGKAWNLSCHNARMNATRRHFFGEVPALELSNYIHTEEKRRTRCRVTYAKDILCVEYFPYRMRPVQNLKLIQADHVDYTYKYADRSALDALFLQRGIADDVLISRNGLLTDTTIANIALWNGKEWHTPSSPLLKGTKRSELIHQGILVEKDIKVSELGAYQRICLFNAMLHFGEVELSIEHIK